MRASSLARLSPPSRSPRTASPNENRGSPSPSPRPVLEGGKKEGESPAPDAPAQRRPPYKRQRADLRGVKRSPSPPAAVPRVAFEELLPTVSGGQRKAPGASRPTLVELVRVFAAALTVSWEGGRPQARTAAPVRASLCIALLCSAGRWGQGRIERIGRGRRSSHSPLLGSARRVGSSPSLAALSRWEARSGARWRPAGTGS